MQVDVDVTDLVMPARDVELLMSIAREQLMFPAWRNANPIRTQELANIAHRVKVADQERRDRSYQWVVETFSNLESQPKSIEELKAEIKRLTEEDSNV
ncbi:MAG: hypothetical protein HC769_21780 [Cyanobacteria bacterium CRU_2_1]|nr:hypothetical protein [Cyanobacteria bacterium CRU_2_1]